MDESSDNTTALLVERLGIRRYLRKLDAAKG